jgi:hypothetical protein
MTHGVYATPEQVKRYLISLNDETFNPDNLNERDEDLIRRFTIQAARAFDAFCRGRHFYPVRQTRLYNHPNGSNAVSGTQSYPSPFGTVTVGFADELRLDEDLLEVVTLTTNNGDTVIAAGDYFLLTGPNYNYSPYDRICLKRDGDQSVFLYSGTTQQANSIDGYWGYHQDWSNAWANSQDTVQDAPSLSSSATTLTVANVDGVNHLGLTPRFETFQLLRIESEYLFVTSMDRNANTMTVIRGVNGTTAASHAQSKQIDVFQPMPEIVAAMQVMTAHAYRRKDVVGTQTDRPIATTAASGVIIMPPRLPEEVQSILKVYKRSD